MVQRAARVEVSPPSADLPPVGKPEDLGRDWVVLRSCRLRPSDRGSSPSVLIHPERGIAVLDVPPSATPDAVDAVRARLNAARFEGIFAGHLPVVHLQAAPRQMPALPAMLDDAFAALPPLNLPGGDAWASVAARALLAEQLAPRFEAQPVRGGAVDGRRRRRRRAAGLRAVGTVLLCLSALGGVLALALKEVPSPVAPVGAPPPVAAIAPPLSESAAPLEATALPAPTPAPEPDPAAPSSPVLNGGTVAAPVPEAPPSLAPVSPPSGFAAPPPAPRAVQPSPPRRAEALAPPPRKATDRAAPQQQQRRQQQQDAGADPLPPAAASPPGAAAQRCSRVAERIGSGAPLGEADMRFFNEACIRW